MTLVVVDAVGLTPRALKHMPRTAKLGATGFQAALDPIVPAVTCSVQASFVTGKQPTDHGIVGNGWYFRDLGEVFLWRQHNKLVQGEKVWETARRAKSDFRVANVCWWYAMGASTDLTVTPRPIYYADGAKAPDCYTFPPQLHDNLVGPLGEFPLFQYWGPTANIKSTKWIADATKIVLDNENLDMALVYLPHLDYDHQRFGPESPEALTAARELDEVLGDLIDHCRTRGDQIVVLSEYGITEARRPVEINRALRRAGFLNVYTQAGMEYLDPWTSRAFCVSDHQIGHVYVPNAADIPAVRELLTNLEGVGEVLEGESLAAAGLNHERSGELVVLAERDAWFTYHYWLDNKHAPDFGQQVEIHRKPGYDPAELLWDPDDEKGAKIRGAKALVRKKTGFRYVLSVVGLDASKYIKGTHGLMPPGDEDGPVFLCSEGSHARDRVAATDVRDLLLDLAGVTEAARAS
ncbi:alkaline phosphatase family protein [Solirubrobacter phytolaccae]|uniref:Alkaline phosphatase family protein n=1 Tax=Solirubrobacter phytolaccae TaxID=1404360 RepID=A0A9X3NEG4_9ACTN|nr:nucleotide pyrophosphatase/phosphodiesterase family protein [Solirubrobacter phytolaccae]MDA0184576.1 alkaline phosphatase family protein [Solirubrobacter phytolaccae]